MRLWKSLLACAILIASISCLTAQFAPRSIPAGKIKIGGGGFGDGYDKSIDEDWDDLISGPGGSAGSSPDSLGGSEIVDEPEYYSLEEYAEAQACELLPDIEADSWDEQEVIDAKLLWERKNLAAKLIRNLTVEQIRESDLENKSELINAANRQYQRELQYNQQYLLDYRLAQYNFNTADGFSLFPSWSKYHTQAFFEGTDYDDTASKIFKNNLVSFSPLDQAASTYNEIIYDYLGPFRVSVGTLLSMASSDYDDDYEDPDYMTDNAVQRFLGGGGNFVLGLAYPLLYANFQNSNTLLADVTFYPRLSFDVPKLAAQSDLGAVNCDIGLESSVYAAGLLGNIALFGRGRLAMMNGNKAFFENLGAPNKAHYFGQVSVGIAVTSMFRIYYSWFLGFGDKFIEDNFKSMISISIIPIDYSGEYYEDYDWE